MAIKFFFFLLMVTISSLQTADSKVMHVGYGTSYASFSELKSNQTGVRILPSTRISKDGNLISWKASIDNSTDDTFIRFIALRPTGLPEANGYYEVIYVTKYMETAGFSFITLQELIPIVVKAGDVLGFQFVNGNPILYDTKQCNESTYKILDPRLPVYDKENITMTRYLLVEPQEDGHLCRKYNFEAEVILTTRDFPNVNRYWLDCVTILAVFAFLGAILALLLASYKRKWYYI